MPRLPALLCTLCTAPIAALAPAPSVLVVGGTGRIGTAVAIHLLQRRPELQVILAGRSAERGAAATAEVAAEAADCGFIELNYRDATEMRAACDGVDALVHVAGPFVGQNKLEPLKAAIASETPVYVDVSDPLEYIDEAQRLDARKTSALLCAGAFPGFSNVLAVEAAHVLGEPVKDLNFSYFTAGLGGSGAINLDITNYGFGPPVPRIVAGESTRTEAYAGTDFGIVDYDGLAAECWAWPFPEAATTGEFLKITGSSRAGMGTAPAIWNTVLRLMVAVVPRAWWSSKRFSEGLARFSEPLVRVTDAFVGESHAMRVDVSSATSDAAVAAVQRHGSFRRCVGQSCAEFVLDALDQATPGISLPEERYADAASRERILARLSSTPGTTGYRVG
jgi:hypothetical protein